MGTFFYFFLGYFERGILTQLSPLRPNQAKNQPGRTDGQKDVRKEFALVFYRASVLWGRCPAPTPPLQLITPSRALGTADHVQSLVFPILDYIYCSTGSST